MVLCRYIADVLPFVSPFIVHCALEESFDVDEAIHRPEGLGDAFRANVMRAVAARLATSRAVQKILELVGADVYAVVALKPRLFTALIKAATEVILASNETLAEPTATASTFVPGTDFNAVETLAAQPPQCIP